MRIQFDRNAAALQPKLFQDLLEIARRVGIVSIPPDPDIFDGARLLRLNQIWAAGQQNDRPVVSGDHGALEKHVATSIEAGKPEVAFLRENQHRIDAPLSKLSAKPGQTSHMFFACKRQKFTGIDYHGRLLPWAEPLK